MSKTARSDRVEARGNLRFMAGVVFLGAIAWEVYAGWSDLVNRIRHLTLAECLLLALGAGGIALWQHLDSRLDALGVTLDDLSGDLDMARRDLQDALMRVETPQPAKGAK